MSSRNDEDPFLITSELAIRALLRSIQRASSLLRMYVYGNPEQSIVTTILALDTTEKRVIVDSSPDPELNERLVRATAVVFDTQVDHVHVHFTAQNLRQITHDSLPALAFPYPAAVRRVQRRDFYRVEIPRGEPISCSIPLLEPEKPPRHVIVKMKDISVGGIALLDTDNQLPHETGITIRGAKLTLPEVGEAAVDLEVLRTHTIVLPNKKEIVEVACKFHNPTKTTTLLVQSYIGRLERRLNAKRRGF